MHPDLPVLVELQEIDQEIARLTAEVAALPRHVAEIEARLKSHLEKLEADRQTLTAHLKARKGFEVEIQAIREKISKYRDQMVVVKTNEQYRALQHEIEFAEENIRSFEDKILEKMVLDEELDTAVKKAQARLAEEKLEVEKEKAVAAGRTREDETALARHQEHRKELVSQLSEKSYSEYTRLSRRPPSIAEVREGACQACRVRLRPQALNEMRFNNTIRYCESCRRILFYVAAGPPEEAVTA